MPEPRTPTPEPQSFRYLPPGTEEQRAFAMQVLATLLGVGIAVALSFATRDSGLKAVLWGASLATIWMLARAAWQLELKARRAQHEEIRIDANGLHLDREKGSTVWAWHDIEGCEARGGKLYVKTAQSTLELSAREVEDGMNLLREIVLRWHQAHGHEPEKSSNFIPLLPR